MRKVRFILPALILVAGMVFSSGSSYGKVEDTKKETKACVVCHVSASSKDLNDAGKHYKEKGTLEGAPKKDNKK
jgi:hypothetical protein